MFEKSLVCVVATLAPSILIVSSSYLEVTRIAITSWMSSNFSQIQPLTEELSALDCVKNQYSLTCLKQAAKGNCKIACLRQRVDLVKVFKILFRPGQGYTSDGLYGYHDRFYFFFFFFSFFFFFLFSCFIF